MRRTSPEPAEPTTATTSAAPSAPRTLAVTLGDPRGIGPEVAEAAAHRLRESSPIDRPRLLFIGPHGSRARASADAFQGVGPWHPGDGAARAGQLAVRAVEEAARLALAGEVDGIVTAPLEKSALHAAGYPWPGHTEMLAELAGVPDVAMMMCAETTPAGGALRVVLATIHIPLRDVAGAFTEDRLVAQTRHADRALREQWGIAAPRLGLCAFNPHASDSGLFGDEEARIYAPAIAALTAAGIDARGPYPADTVFLRALRGELDAVIAPYHDVGMAAFKTAAFGRGVNVTLGLPFVRTSPDHGTAFDIAGTGAADPSSMVEAIALADALARRSAAGVR